MKINDVKDLCDFTIEHIGCSDIVCLGCPLQKKNKHIKLKGELKKECTHPIWNYSMSDVPLKLTRACIRVGCGKVEEVEIHKANAGLLNELFEVKDEKI